MTIDMLSKELCMRCRNEFFGAFRWDKDDEAWWEMDYVDCPSEYDEYDDELPPKKCPYRLEHLIATQKKPVKSLDV